MVVLQARRRQVADDGEAFVRSLYEEHGRALLAFAARLTSDRAAAEDIVQETLLRAWKHRDSLADGSARPWLLTVARNLVTDRIRARAVRPMEVAETASGPPVQRDHADAVTNTMVVMQALERLSSLHRDVLVELYFRGRSVAETAGVLGIPAGTVKSRSYYALRELRDALGESRMELNGVAR